MKGAEADITKLLLAAIAVAALYDILFINGGQPAVSLAKAVFGGIGGVFARITGQTPPAGY